MQGKAPLATVPKSIAPEAPAMARPGLMTKVMNRALKTKLPRLFRGKGIESKSTIKITHKKVKFW